MESAVKKTNKGKWFATLLCTAVLALSTGAAYRYRNDINLPEISLPKLKRGEKKTQTVKCSLLANMGRRHVLKMEMAIPCRDEEQRAELEKKLPRIRSDFLSSVDQSALESWVKERDFPTIRKQVLTVINRHSKEEIGEVYFDAFNFF
jgi:flagellar basal body-associated protein FliL